MVKFIYNRFLPLSLLSFLASLTYYLTVYVRVGENFNALRWNLSHLHMNYIDLGFIKRGILGTVFRPFLALLEDGGSMEFATIISFDIIICAVFIFALSIILKSKNDRPGQSLWFLMLILLIAPTGFMQLSIDITRYDHLSFLLVVLALLLVWKHHAIGAGLVLGLAVLNHEAVVIWGVPVVLAYGLKSLCNAGVDWRKMALLSGPAILVAIMVLLFGGAEIDPASVLDARVSLAASVWSRGIVEPELFFRKYQYLVILFYAIMPFILLYRAHPKTRKSSCVTTLKLSET
jgi:hypothetical protein